MENPATACSQRDGRQRPRPRHISRSSVALSLALALVPLVPPAQAFYQTTEASASQSTASGPSAAALAHGIAAWVAMGLLVPLGMFAASWSEGGKRRAWTHTHWIVQLCASLVVIGSSVAAIVLLWSPSNTSAHSVLGFISLGAVVVQVPLGCLLHCPLPAGLRRTLLWIHRVWGPLAFAVGSAAIVSGMLQLDGLTGQAFVIVASVCGVQILWSLTVLAATVFLRVTAVEADGDEGLGLKGGLGHKGDLSGIRVEAVPRMYTPVDIDGPLSASWQCKPQEGGTQWHPVEIK